MRFRQFSKMTEREEFCLPAVWLNRLKTGVYEERTYFFNNGRRKKVAIEKVKGKDVVKTLKCDCICVLNNFDELELITYHTCK